MHAWCVYVCRFVCMRVSVCMCERVYVCGAKTHQRDEQIFARPIHLGVYQRVYGDVLRHLAQVVTHRQNLE